MTTNVTFDDVAYLRAVKNATDETIILDSSIADLRSELVLLLEGMKNLKDGLNDGLAKAFMDTSSQSDIVKTSLKGVGEAVGFLANAFTALVSAKTAIEIITATSAFVAARDGILAIVIAVGIYTSTTTLATLATDLLNLALKALPFIAMAALVTAVIVGIVALINHFTQAGEEQKKLNAQTETMKKNTDELTKSLSDSKSAYQESIDKMNLNAGAAQVLADKVFSLSEQEGKTAEQKKQLSVLVDELNKSMPGLNLVYDEQADCLSKTAEQVQGLIEVKKEEILQQAASERALELAKEMLDIETQLNDAQAKQAELDAKLAEGTINQNEYNKTMEDRKVIIDDLNAKYQETSDVFDITTESIVTSAQKQSEAIKNSSGDMSEAYATQQATMEETARLAEEAQKREEEALKQREEKLKNYTDTATNMFSSIETESKTSVADMISNLENNQKALEEWSSGIAALADKGINAGLLEKLKSAGPESAGIVKNLVKASDDELKKLNDVFSSGAGVATEALIKELGLPAVENSGSDMVDNISEGVANNGNLEKETVKLIKATLDTAQAEINNGGFVTVGKQIAEGMAQGVRDGTDILVQAVRAMAQAAVSAARAALDIHSPSRLFRNSIGLMVSLGFSEGIRNGFDNVVRTSEEMADKAFKGMDYNVTRGIQKLTDSFSGAMPVPIYATGRAVPYYTPSSGYSTSNDDYSKTFTQYVNLTGNEMSDVQKIRLLQIQSRRMLRLGV